MIDSIGVDDRTEELKIFLMQTAKSDDFEYKVSMDFAHQQFEDAGFVNIQTEKIWPNDNLFDYKVGTFVEVWRYLG